MPLHDRVGWKTDLPSLPDRRSPIIRSFLFVIRGWRLKTTQCRMAVARGERTFGEAPRAALMAASSFLISLRDCNISLRTSIVSRCLWISASSMVILHGVAGNVIQPIQARWNTTAAHASIGRRHAPDHSLDRAALNGATPKVLRRYGLGLSRGCQAGERDGRENHILGDPASRFLSTSLRGQACSL